MEQDVHAQQPSRPSDLPPVCPPLVESWTLRQCSLGWRWLARQAVTDARQSRTRSKQLQQSAAELIYTAAELQRIAAVLLKISAQLRERANQLLEGSDTPSRSMNVA